MLIPTEPTLESTQKNREFCCVLLILSNLLVFVNAPSTMLIYREVCVCRMKICAHFHLAYLTLLHYKETTSTYQPTL